MPEFHLSRRRLVHVHLVLRHQVPDQIPGLHAETQLPYLLWPRSPAGLLLRVAIWFVWWPEYCLVPVGHLPQIDGMLMNVIHDAGFACLGLIVGLVALWSP